MLFLQSLCCYWPESPLWVFTVFERNPGTREGDQSGLSSAIRCCRAARSSGKPNNMKQSPSFSGHGHLPGLSMVSPQQRAQRDGICQFTCFSQLSNTCISRVTHSDLHTSPSDQTEPQYRCRQHSSLLPGPGKDRAAPGHPVVGAGRGYVILLGGGKVTSCSRAPEGHRGQVSFAAL